MMDFTQKPMKKVIKSKKGKIMADGFVSANIEKMEKFESGATVVGRGKGIFSVGYQIPPGTKVKIIRPK